MREQSNRVTITTITKKYFCSYLEVRIGGEVALHTLVALVWGGRLGLQTLRISYSSKLTSKLCSSSPLPVY